MKNLTKAFLDRARALRDSSDLTLLVARTCTQPAGLAGRTIIRDAGFSSEDLAWFRAPIRSGL